MIYDISVLLGVESINYPGDTPFRREQLQTIASGAICDVSRLTMSPHAGTHLDAPAHFIAGGKTIDQYAASDFILPAVVVETHDARAVLPGDLTSAGIRPGDAVLFKTENSRRGLPTSAAFTKDYVYISLEASEALVKLGVKLVGIDYISVERYGDEAYPTHKTLSRNGILLLEGANLKDVPPGRYNLTCLPLRLAGSEASPVRAILSS